MWDLVDIFKSRLDPEASGSRRLKRGIQSLSPVPFKALKGGKTFVNIYCSCGERKLPLDEELQQDLLGDFPEDFPDLIGDLLGEDFPE